MPRQREVYFELIGLVIEHTEKEVKMTTASMNSINCLQTMVEADRPTKGRRFIKVKEGVLLSRTGTGRSERFLVRYPCG